ncbi:MAG: hypothetical protein AMXMBFR84_24140 [Candidatus Hydrogenedentota bacterium]
MIDLSPSSTRAILAIIPNWLGDVAMCTPALRAVHRRFPNARIAVAGRASACALLKDLPYIAERIVIPSKPSLLAMWTLSGRLRPYARDLAIVFPHSFRAAMLARLTRARIRVGYRRNGRQWLLTHAVDPHRKDGRIEPVYMAREYLDLVMSVGADDDGAGLELRACESEVRAVRARMPAQRPRVGIAPGAAFGPSKRWLPDRYAAVADALADRAGASCFLITGPGEEETREAVFHAAKRPLYILDDNRPSIDSLKATISQLDLLIGNDSGPRHVAVAFGVPVICVMGSTAPAYSVGPYEKGEVLRIDVDCGPCQKPVCVTDHRCMTGVPVERVVEAALRHLK